MNHPDIEQALLHLAQRCDGAGSRDGQGFNKLDAGFGHSLADQIGAGRSLSDKQHHAAMKMMLKYIGQLTNAGIGLPIGKDELDDWLKTRAEILDTQPAGCDGQIWVEEETVIVRLGSDYRKYLDTVKAIGAKPEKGIGGVAKYNYGSQTWALPIDWLPETVEALKGFQLDAIALQIYQKMQEEKASANAKLAKEQKIREAEVRMLLELAALDKPLRNGWELMPHQKVAVEFVFNRGGKVIIGDDMGLGKTIEALKAAKAYQDLYHCPIFVICPATLKANWKREAGYVGANIEIFSQDFRKIPEAPEIGQFVLIVDECHAFKAMTTARTKAFLSLASAKNCRAAILLSGTPIKNGSPADIFPSLKAIGHPLGDNQKAFNKRYGACNSTHLKELHRKMTEETPCMIRRKITEVKDLPKFTRNLLQGELDPEAKRVYDATFKRLQDEYYDRISNGDISENGWQLVMLNHLRHAGSKAKIGYTVQMAKDFLEGSDGDDGEQIVIFTTFKDTADAIARQLIAAGYETEILNGDTNQKDRDPMVQRFQTGQTKAIVCLAGAGGVGITLTSSHIVILADRDWNCNQQLEARVYRTGQKYPVQSYWIQHTEVDRKIDLMLCEKQERIDLMLEGYPQGMEGLENLADFAEELLSEIF